MTRNKQKDGKDDSINICLRCRGSHTEETPYCKYCREYRHDRKEKIKAEDALYRKELRKYLRLDNEEAIESP